MLSTSIQYHYSTKLKAIFKIDNLKEYIKYQKALAAANGLQVTSWQALRGGIVATTKAMGAWLISNPMGWIILLGGTIAATVGLVDLFTTSVEEHREKLESLKSEYSDLKSELDGLKGELDGTQSRINELESKGKLTFTEAEELNNLRKQNNELQRSIDLLELQNKTKKKELNNQFVETMNSDIEQELYTRNENGEVVQYMPMSGQTATDDNEANYITQRFKDLEKLRDELSSASTEAEKERIKRQIKGIEDYFVQKNKDFTETAEGIDYIQNPTTKDDKKVNEWLDYINDFQDKMAIAMGGDNAKENAFNRLVDNWKFDELLNPLQKLGKEGKVTAEKLKDPAYAEFIKRLQEIGFITDDSTGSLRFVANAFNGVSDSASLSAAKTGEAISAIIADLDNEAKACGTTSEEFGKLIGQHVLFGNTSLKTQDKIIAIKALETALGDCSDEMKYLLSLMNVAAGNFDPKTTSSMTDDEKQNRQRHVKKYLQDKFGFGVVDIPEKEEIENSYNPTDDDKGKDNTPGYEDPTDVIINRINLRADELAQQEEEIQNLIEIAELEKDYKKQISLTNDLIATRKQRVDELNAANARLHNEAQVIRDANPWDEESWFDSQGNATEAYYDLYNSSSKDDQEKIKNTFDSISKIKKAWVENDEERLDLVKQILQEEEKIWDLKREEFDERLEESEDYIEHANNFGWENGDNEIAARKRVLEWIESDYYRSLIKDDKEYYDILAENRLKYNEALKDEFNKVADFGSSYYNSKKTLLQSHYDVTNSIAEAQHEINKELEASMTMYEYLDEETRKLLFNQEDYNKLSEELYDIQYKSEKLRRQYTYDLQNATIENLEEITSQYEMQYETLMKSYEIAKAELEVAKKRQQLDNVLAEKNVRMLINGQWQWVANTQDVINAQSELADAKYAMETAKAGLRQTESIHDLTAKQDHLGTVISEFENGVIDLDSAIYEVTRMFGALPSAMKNAISRIDPSFTYSGGRSSGYAEFNGAKFYGIPDDLLPSGAVKHYATGTKKTSKGLASINEILPEGLITNDGALIPMANFSGGEMVFNHEMMENLWHQAQIPWNIPSVSIPDFVTRAPSSGQSIVYDIHDFEVNPTDVDSFVQDLSARARSYNAITNKMK